MRFTDVLTRWSEAQTTLSCVAGVAAGPRLADVAVHIPSCTLSFDPSRGAFLASTASLMRLPDWSDAIAAEVHATDRGTSVELLFPNATITVADF